MDITQWITWMLTMLIKAIEQSEIILQKVEFKRKFWEKNKAIELNPRQHKVLTKLLDNTEININSDRWSRITKCTKMTATRHINDLIEKGVFTKSESGGRSTFYRLKVD
jgi:Fic family protein